MKDLYEHKWDNRTEEGLDLVIDGYGEQEEHEIVDLKDSATYKRKMIEEEDQQL